MSDVAPAAPSPVRVALETAVTALDVACSGRPTGSPRDHRRKLRALLERAELFLGGIGGSDDASGGEVVEVLRARGDTEGGRLRKQEAEARLREHCREVSLLRAEDFGGGVVAVGQVCVSTQKQSASKPLLRDVCFATAAWRIPRDPDGVDVAACGKYTRNLPLRVVDGSTLTDCLYLQEGARAEIVRGSGVSVEERVLLACSCLQELAAVTLAAHSAQELALIEPLTQLAAPAQDYVSTSAIACVSRSF